MLFRFRDGGQLFGDAGEVKHFRVGAVGRGDGGEVEGFEGWGEAGDEEHVGFFCFA